MEDDYDSQLDQFSEPLRPESKIVVLTGAGISEESGIPTFRGKGGLWEKYDPEKYATAEALRKRPKEVWEMHDELRQTIASCKPNAAHIALADLQSDFEYITVITQNVDNYHQDAGSKHVLELHGNAWRVRCTTEGNSWEDKTVPYKELPPKCSCGANLRPDVVFFNEQLDRNILDLSFFEASTANIMLVVGTSYVVYPAAYIPIMAKQNGAFLVEFNLEPTAFSSLADLSLFGKAGTTLPEFVEKLQSNIIKD